MGLEDLVLPNHLPVHRFTEFGPLNPAEREAVIELAGPPRTYRPREVVRRADVPTNGFFLLVSGWATASVELPNGKSQIVKVHLQGDVLGTPSMSVTRSVETLCTVTAAVVAEVSYERFGRLLEGHPRLAAYFLLSVQRERVSLIDQLASLGRTSAESRLAAFLLDIEERVVASRDGNAGGFELPLTQEQIGDALGLTNVHVNRMLRELETASLIIREGRWIEIGDRQQLASLAARPHRELARNARWLPPAR